MITYFRPSGWRFKKPGAEAMATEFKTGALLLKIGQTIFVGIAVISFVILFQGK